MKLRDETITVFNTRLNEDTGYDVYIPTVIKGVSWFCEIASTVTDAGLKSANIFKIRIPVDADFSGKSYVPPVEYADANPESAFTLKQGDIIVRGTETEELSPAALMEKYGEMVTIQGVTDNRRAPNAKHWRVVGE